MRSSAGSRSSSSSPAAPATRGSPSSPWSAPSESSPWCSRRPAGRPSRSSGTSGSSTGTPPGATTARTLLSEPRALLLDEPFSKLDADLKQRFRGFVLDHARTRNLPVLLVTHDPADAEAAQGPLHVLPGFADG